MTVQIYGHRLPPYQPYRCFPLAAVAAKGVTRLLRWNLKVLPMLVSDAIVATVKRIGDGSVQGYTWWLGLLACYQLFTNFLMIFFCVFKCYDRFVVLL
jgi:hypothetical protein